MVLTPTIGEKSYNRQDWQKGYQSQPNEYDYEVEDIEGQIPADLQGTVFKNDRFTQYRWHCDRSSLRWGWYDQRD